MSTQTGSGFSESHMFSAIHYHVDELVNCIRKEFDDDNTFVRLTINTNNLQGSIRIPYYKVSKLNSDVIYNTVSPILQSSQKLEVGKWFVTIHSVTPEQP